MGDHDRELIERAREGDGAAIGELFSRYWRAARAAAFGVTGDLAAAEDAAADAFRQVWTSIGSLRDPDRFGPWLRTIVVRKARLARRSQPASTGVSEDLADAREAPAVTLERLEMAALVQQLVCQLPAGLREAVSLFYFEGYDSADAARFLGIPDGTLRRRLHDGRRLLRVAVERVLAGERRMDQEEGPAIERLRDAIDRADRGNSEPLYEALRASLIVRPASGALFDELSRMQEASGRGAIRDYVRVTARRLAGSSSLLSDPAHPAAGIAGLIRRALPEFQDWTHEAGGSTLPPGFAEGRPGAFLRATRGLLLTAEDGSVRSTYEALRDHAALPAFRVAMTGARLGDAIDLTWMTSGPLELRTVQDLLERLCAAVLPRAVAHVAPYDEPRYRSALRLQLDDLRPPAAIGGVLQSGRAGRKRGARRTSASSSSPGSRCRSQPRRSAQGHQGSVAPLPPPAPGRSIRASLREI